MSRASPRNKDDELCALSVHRVPTNSERAADAVIHVLGLGLGVPAALAIVALAAIFGSAADTVTAAIYASGLVAMFACSAAYNMLHRHRWRDWLQRFDHAAIFAMIAGSRFGASFTVGITTLTRGATTFCCSSPMAGGHSCPVACCIGPPDLCLSDRSDASLRPERPCVVGLASPRDR